MVKDTNLPQIVFNKLSKQKYQELRANNQLDPNQFYITPDELDEEKYNIKYSQITNCITEIPQDIKCELNSIDNSITIKAGSKIYFPAGFEEDSITRKFNIVTLENDINCNYIYAVQALCCIRSDTLEALSLYTKQCYSGESLPSIPSIQGPGVFWYDTVNNLIKYSTDKGQTWKDYTLSLPIFLATGNDQETNQNWKSLDQVFNGFGFIGSTVFSLPGVEGLIPNGRNLNGRLNNTKIITTSVKTSTTAGTYNFHIQLLSNGNVAFVANYYEQSTPPSNISYTVWFNTEENIKYLGDGTSWVRQDSLDAGTLYATAGRITSFNIKNTFHAVDYNDLERLQQQINTLSQQATSLQSNLTSVQATSVDLTSTQQITEIKTLVNEIINARKEEIRSWNLPDYTKIQKDLSFPFTAPSAGLFYCNYNTSGKGDFTINENIILTLGDNDSGNEGPFSTILNQGDTITFSQSAFNITFVPFKGQ